MNDDVKSKRRVQLVEKGGKTSIHVRAEIDDRGNLLISGQDVGEAAREFWGDDDYEYWLLVESAEKDHLLLKLIQHVYGGKPRAFEEFLAWVKANGIPYTFDSYA